MSLLCFCPPTTLSQQLERQHFNSEIVLFHLSKLQQNMFSVGFRNALDLITNQLNFSHDKTTKDGCERPLTATEDKQEIQAAAASPVDAKEISMDDAVVRTQQHFHIKSRNKWQRRLFLVVKMFLLDSWHKLLLPGSTGSKKKCNRSGLNVIELTTYQTACNSTLCLWLGFEKRDEITVNSACVAQAGQT